MARYTRTQLSASSSSAVIKDNFARDNSLRSLSHPSYLFLPADYSKTATHLLRINFQLIPSGFPET